MKASLLTSRVHAAIHLPGKQHTSSEFCLQNSTFVCNFTFYGIALMFLVQYPSLSVTYICRYLTIIFINPYDDNLKSIEGIVLHNTLKFLEIVNLFISASGQLDLTCVSKTEVESKATVGILNIYKYLCTHNFMRIHTYIYTCCMSETYIETYVFLNYTKRLECVHI